MTAFQWIGAAALGHLLPSSLGTAVMVMGLRALARLAGLSALHVTMTVGWVPKSTLRSARARRTGTC